ncbi:DUF1996 domain-containing protein [Fusarium keratoplasticum]|nr:DUF1996 domain-containing protein [Fusarium keratoplasticum]
MKPTGLFRAFFGAALIAQTVAFFRVTCAPWKRERIDSLVSPGAESSHMHTFWGSRKISADTVNGADFQDGCTSCDNQLDKSAYWMPTLYYVKKNVTVPVKVGIFHVYYQGQENNPGLYPEDFALIGGNPKITEDEIREQGGNGIHWHFDESDEVKEKWQFPKKRGTGWLRGNVPFPGWVVKDKALGRYRACNDTVDTGCISVPGMFFAVWYDVGDAEFFTFEDGDYLTLSSGGGHTYHGDFIMGWDKSALWEVSHNTTEFAKIGGEAAYVRSDTCNATAEATTYLWDLDWQTVLAAKNGSLTESVVTGTYDNFLTITDGKSVNATWSGKWGEEGSSVDDGEKALDEASSVSVSSPSTSASAPSTVASSSGTADLSQTTLSTATISAKAQGIETVSTATLAASSTASAQPTSSSYSSSSNNKHHSSSKTHFRLHQAKKGCRASPPKERQD